MQGGIMRGKVFSLPAVLLAVILSLVLAACGSSSQGGTPDDAQSVGQGNNSNLSPPLSASASPSSMSAPTVQPLQDLIPSSIPSNYCTDEASPGYGASTEISCAWLAGGPVNPTGTLNSLPFSGITYYQFSSQAALDTAYSQALANFRIIENEKSCTIDNQIRWFDPGCEAGWQNPQGLSGRMFEGEQVYPSGADMMMWTANQQLMMVYINGGAEASGDSFVPWWTISPNWIAMP
jgi:hypothetical protein